MRVCLVDIGEYLPRISALNADQWHEHGYGYEFKPDRATYKRVQDNGNLVLFVAFDGEEIIGYASAMICPSLWNDQVVTCISDAIFVSKPYRNTSAGGRLILAIENEARKRGALFVQWGVKPGSRLHKTFAKRGYEAKDIMMFKELS